MKKKVYYLSTCDTCKRIMKEVGVDDSFEQQDIKTTPVTEEQVESFYKHTNSYEAVINKRARKTERRFGRKTQLKKMLITKSCY